MQWSDLPPLSMIRAFEAAARLRGFSAAGRELNVTQAAIGQQVRGLERRLGVALMRRQGRGVTLTVEGRRLADGLGEGLAAIRTALGEVIDLAADRPVRVTMTTHFAASWLSPRLGAFRARHPGVELLLNPTGDLIDLARSDFDLAIRYGVGPWPGLAAERLMVSPKVVVAAPSLVAGRRIDHAADLLSLPWVQELGVDEWRVWLAQHDVDPGAKRDIYHMPGHMAFEALRSGQGVGLTARMLVEEDLSAGRLIALFEDPPGETAAGYVLLSRPGPMRADLAAFVNWLRAEARTPAGRA